MFNAARVPQSRRREQQPYELSCTLAGRWMKFWLGTSMLEVFRCLGSVDHGCFDGVWSWRERIHSRRAFFMVRVG